MCDAADSKLLMDGVCSLDAVELTLRRDARVVSCVADADDALRGLGEVAAAADAADAGALPDAEPDCVQMPALSPKIHSFTACAICSGSFGSL